MITTAPAGTLSQKIHGQEMPCTTAPPSSGPSGTASPVTAVNVPSTRGRSAGGNATLSSASATGITMAAPAPWTARAAINHPAPVARAHAADAAVNNPRPAMNTRRRPSRSPAAAAGISSTAKLRV